MPTHTDGVSRRGYNPHRKALVGDNVRKSGILAKKFVKNKTED